MRVRVRACVKPGSLIIKMLFVRDGVGVILIFFIIFCWFSPKLCSAISYYFIIAKNNVSKFTFM